MPTMGRSYLTREPNSPPSAILRQVSTVSTYPLSLISISNTVPLHIRTHFVALVQMIRNPCNTIHHWME